tara:strand:+ start:650 stop:1213 length:564 start_codon:yes stop_codon:yes gene_type:complete
MRIIGGQVSGTNLVKFDGKRIRPTLDRVKESLFNQIQPYLEGICFLDLFAGTGAIGLEAWSRGANSVILVENDSQAFDLICKNIEKCKVEKAAIVLRSDAFQALSDLEFNGAKCDLIYIDPPFTLNLHDICLERLSGSSIVKENSMIIVEHHHRTILRESYDKIFLSRQRKLGDTRLSFYGSCSLFS